MAPNAERWVSVKKAFEKAPEEYLKRNPQAQEQQAN
jgi:hypothetical protein